VSEGRLATYVALTGGRERTPEQFDVLLHGRRPRPHPRHRHRRSAAHRRGGPHRQDL